MRLVGLAEIAMAAGVQKQAVCNWAVRHVDFPRPVAELACGDIWDEAEVLAWLTRTGRRTDAGWSLDEVSSSNRRRPHRWQEPKWKAPA